ncbi:class I SAM-dependent methyltransferase [Anaerovorax odorimutans]|uniref:class I SAM-dependent methyltransferase n=1 Tax=Anaerovorax odorimutans TaxID=109327 RepID=UPI00041161EB|nr:class I SAM-dependent methyltransferase [Anaerovorax odorimutans]
MNSTDIKEFRKTAEEIFAPIYPVIADNIIKKTKADKGLCIDIGTGTGCLGLAIAKKLPDMEVILSDISEEMIKIADTNIEKAGNGNRVKTKKGNVEALPFQDSIADLIVSRGSIFFWEDVYKGILEIYRVLKPGGFAYIGGGFGNEELTEKINAQMVKKNPNWFEERKDRIGEDRHKFFEETIKRAKIPNYEIERGKAGLWIIFQK